MSSFTPGWYVIYTRPQQERKVVSHLEKRRIKHYLPTTSKISLWHDRKKLIHTPLFPSYVFVWLNELKDFYDTVNDNSGFMYFLKDGSVNARVDQKTIDCIQMIACSAKEIECINYCIHPGKVVEIAEGPFSGLCCQVVEHDSKQKILVRISLLNRYLLATLSLKNILKPTS